MTTGIDQIITQNVAAVAMAAMFLWYVNKRDSLMQRTFDSFADRLDKLTSAISSLEHRIKSVESEERRQRKEAHG